MFALLFIVGLLFSTRSPVRVKERPTATPADTHVEGQSEWGHDAASSDTPRRQESGKPRW